MGLVIKLFGLQELEFEIKALEKVLADARSNLGESPALREARAYLKSSENIYKQLSDQQKTLEWQSEDLKNKLNKANEQLYSGRIKNPKELTNLQHEAELLSANLARVEEQALEAIEKSEQAEAIAQQSKQHLSQVEASWQEEQKNLAEEIKSNEDKLAKLQEKRNEAAGEFDTDTVKIYERLKLQRGFAIARIAQGACGGCHISLSSAQLQRSRGSALEKCANCGRILFSE